MLFRSVTTGDFNADGRSDLAVANVNSSNVSILRGNGDGTFQAAVNFGAGSAPASVTTGDFNADGKIDLATANNGSHNVSVLINDSDGAPPCTPGMPALSLSVVSVNWASYADYTQRKLSIDYSIINSSAHDAFNTQITGATASNGVIPLVSPPIAAGNIASGSDVPVTIQYQIPVGTGGFLTWLWASTEDACGTSYTYP